MGISGILSDTSSALVQGLAVACWQLPAITVVRDIWKDGCAAHLRYLGVIFVVVSLFNHPFLGHNLMVGVGGPGPEGISHIPVFGSKFRGCQYHNHQQPTFKGSFEPFRHRIWGIQRWLALFETTFTFQVTQEAEVQRRPKLVFYTSMKVGLIIPVPFQYSLVGLLWIRLLDSYGWSNMTFCVCGKHKHLEMCVVTCRRIRSQT